MGAPPASAPKWECSGCHQQFAGAWQKVCPRCGRENYWTGSFTPERVRIARLLYAACRKYVTPDPPRPEPWTPTADFLDMADAALREIEAAKDTVAEHAVALLIGRCTGDHVRLSMDAFVAGGGARCPLCAADEIAALKARLSSDTGHGDTKGA